MLERPPTVCCRLLCSGRRSQTHKWSLILPSVLIISVVIYVLPWELQGIPSVISRPKCQRSLVSRPKSCPHIQRSFWMKPVTPECLVAHALYSVQVIKESVQLLPINITLQGFLLLCVIYIHAVYTYIKAYMLKDKIINSSSTPATHPTKHTQPHK